MPPIASRYQTQLVYGKEDTPGEVPASPTINILRTTNPLSINGSKDTAQTEETYAHRQVQNVRHTRRSVEGSVPFELSYQSYKDWFEALIGGTWTSNAAGTPNILKVGSDMKTFFIEQQFGDISQYQLLKGVTPSSMSLDVSPDGLVTGSFDVLGMDFEQMNGTSLGSGSSVSDAQPFGGACDAEITEGGSAIDIVTSLSLSVDAAKAQSGLVGNCGTAVAANGMLEVSGTLTAQLKDASLVNKFYDETESSLSITFTDIDDNGKKLTLDIPRIKYMSNGKSENNNEVAVALDFMGLYDNTDASSIILTDSNPA